MCLTLVKVEFDFMIIYIFNLYRYNEWLRLGQIKFCPSLTLIYKEIRISDLKLNLRYYNYGYDR